MSKVTLLTINIAKTFFQLHDVDHTIKVVFRRLSVYYFLTYCYN